MARRVKIAEITLDDFAEMIGAFIIDGVVRDVRSDHQLDCVQVLIESPSFEEVAPLCEPPRFELRRAACGG